MIKLYHGSNVRIEAIDLTLSKKGKDFGKGFYLNADRDQAHNMAVRTANRMQTGIPTVNTYLFDESILQNSTSLNIKIFEDYDEEWAEFVLMNRRNTTDEQTHQFDIVIGPIANDTVGVQISRFMLGYIEMPKLIEELRFRGNHAMQYFFATERAINLLKIVDDGQ